MNRRIKGKSARRQRIKASHRKLWMEWHEFVALGGVLFYRDWLHSDERRGARA